jgi:DNA-binding response OmpR family regulator
MAHRGARRDDSHEWPVVGVANEGRRGLQVRVLLATDRPDLGHALSLYLTECRIDVVDVVCDADCLLARATAERPDVVLVDWHLGDAASTRAVADLQGCGHPMPVVILSTSHESAPARTSGAAAYATLGDPPDALLAVLAAVAPAAL